MKKLFYISVLILFASCLNSQNRSKELTVQEMHQDIDFYFDTLKICSPALTYRYTDLQFDSIRLSLKEKCTAPMSIRDFNFLISGSNKFTDLHSGINIEYILREPIKDSLFFPVVNIRGIDMYSDNKRILSINGKSAEAILSDIDSRISWEYNEKERIYMINKYLTYFLQNEYNMRPPYICDVYTANKGYCKELMPTVGWHEFLTKINPSYSEYHKGILNSLFFEKDNIAVLYYNKCDAYTDSMKIYFEKFTFST